MSTNENNTQKTSNITKNAIEFDGSNTKLIETDVVKKPFIEMDPDKNKMLCDGCVKCCMHINHEIDIPENDEDCDYIIWFLLHENVAIWIDEEKDWYMEFITPCKALKNGLCDVYHLRPQVCREYSQEDCLNTELDDDVKFHTPEEFLEHMKTVRNYDYNGFYKKK